jgi:hypothetical protein
MSKKEYNLVVSFIAGLDYGKIEDEIECVLGRSHGSGYGFGRRDLSYWFNNKNTLYAAVRKARRLGRRLKCEAWDETNSDECESKRVSLRGIK